MKGTRQVPGYVATLFVVLLLAGCAGSSVSDGPGDDVVAMPLTNTYWQLESVAGEEVPETGSEQKAHILFLDDGRVTGYSGCNQYMGKYRVEGENLLFDSLSSTRMACDDNLIEELLFAAFARTVGVYLEGIEFRLLGEDGEELAVFEASRMK